MTFIWKIGPSKPSQTRTLFIKAKLSLIIAIVCLIAFAGVSANTIYATELNEPPAVSEETVHILGAWLASDRRIRSVVYDGQIYIVRDAAQSHLLSFSGRAGESVNGDWFVDMQDHRYRDTGNQEYVLEKVESERVASSGGEMRWWFQDDLHASIEPETNYRMSTLSPFILIGRRMSIVGHPPTTRPLPELILDGKIEAGEWIELEGRSFYRIVARISSSRSALYKILVDLDPEAGFMPVRISSFTPGFESEHVRLTVYEYEEMDTGVYLPIRGSQSIYSHAIVPDAISHAFTAVLDESDIEIAKLDPRFEEDMHRLREAVESVFGSDGYPTAKLIDRSGGGSELRINKYERVNGPLTDSELLGLFPDGSLVWNEYESSYFFVNNGKRVPASQQEASAHFDTVRAGHSR